MKHILLALLLIITIGSMSAQIQKGTLYYKDGRTAFGTVKLKKKGVVKFKNDESTKPVLLKFDVLDSIQVIYYDEFITYVQLEIQRKKKANKFIAEKLVNGEVSLYSINQQGSFAGGSSFSVNSYYLKEEGERFVTYLGSNDAFGKDILESAKIYFKDCTSLLDKIEDREFKKKHINEIVVYYNNNCN